MPSKLIIEAFFDSSTSTFSYLLMDDFTKDAVIVDSVMDYDPKSGRTKTESADKILLRINELGANVHWILETHVHADHFSAAPYLKRHVGGECVIGSHILEVQNVFGDLFNLDDEFKRDGSQFNRLLKDGDLLELGRFKIRAIHTPGHTPACMTYLVEGDDHIHAFVGDTLFMPDYGTARCDFPGGSAEMLYQSIQKVLSLPEDTLLYMCHDYPPATRSAKHLTTVREQKSENIHVHNGIRCEEFVAMREKRDATLSMPVLLLPAVQVNMRAGEFPPIESNGVSYLKIPINGV
jgi:glyoxylase-like metal-dependent hydrolase (beta-lactamase superfamily II)